MLFTWLFIFFQYCFNLSSNKASFSWILFLIFLLTVFWRIVFYFFKQNTFSSFVIIIKISTYAMKSISPFLLNLLLNILLKFFRELVVWNLTAIFSKHKLLFLKYSAYYFLNTFWIHYILYSFSFFLITNLYYLYLIIFIFKFILLTWLLL